MSITSLSGRVRWVETDAAGVAHFTSFLVYCENLEKQILYSDEVNLAEIEDEFNLWIPRVKIECSFHFPLRFNEVYRVELVDIEFGNTSIKFYYRVWNVSHDKLACEAIVIIVCADRDSNKPIRVPDILRSRLENILRGYK
jgi:YbgC/YbaW family acyl-CoA thioester hydrolase